MAHQVFRRGFFATSSPYAPITATSPNLLVPLKYASTSADGQILFQDAACTVPVTTIGDPVGGVKWDGVIVAIQATDANRPIWQGSTRGVEFNGSDQWLYSPESAAFWGFLQDSAGATTVAGVALDSLTLARRRILSTFGGAVGYLIDFDNADFRVFLDDGASASVVAANNAVSDTAAHQVASAHDPSVDTRLYIDGTLEVTGGALPSTATDPDSTAFFGAEPGGSNLLSGAITYIVVYDRVLTQSEIQSIEVS